MGEKMRKVKIPKWIILKYDVQPPEFTCLNCGEKRIAHLPASITDFVKQGEAFAYSHKFCKK